MESNPKFSSLINTLGDSIVVSNTSLTKAEINVLLNNIVYPQDVGDSQKGKSKKENYHPNVKQDQLFKHYSAMGSGYLNIRIMYHIMYAHNMHNNVV